MTLQSSFEFIAICLTAQRLTPFCSFPGIGRHAGQGLALFHVSTFLLCRALFCPCPWLQSTFCHVQGTYPLFLDSCSLHAV